MLKNTINKAQNRKKVIHRFILDFQKINNIIKIKRSKLN